MRCAARSTCSAAWPSAMPALPPTSGIDFRIGINVGDIIIDGDDIFGDGVNVAARLEALADPGGICVSRVVRDQVLDKLSFAFEDLGAQEVKNIARPVEVYRILDDPPCSDRLPAASTRSPWMIFSRTTARSTAGFVCGGRRACSSSPAFPSGIGLSSRRPLPPCRSSTDVGGGHALHACVDQRRR